MGRRAANRRNKGGSAERKEDDASAVTKFDVAWAPLFPPRRKGNNKKRQQACRPRTVVKRRLFRGDMIFSLDDFFSLDECLAWVKFAETSGFSTTFHEESYDIAFRHNGRLQWDDAATAACVWERVAKFVPEEYMGLRAVGCNPNMRLYRYTKGQRFGQHVDEAVESGDNVSVFTLLVYLNGGDGSVEGGHTTFYGDAGEVVLSVAPSAGKALLHGHGDRCLLHEGAEVTDGVKYLFRTDVMYARKKRAPSAASTRGSGNKKRKKRAAKKK